MKTRNSLGVLFAVLAALIGFTSLSRAETLATVDGKPITEKDLEARHQMKLYEAKKQVMEDFLFDYLVGKEATRLNKTADQVMKTEIEGKAKKVSNSEIKKFYDEYASNMQKRGEKAQDLEKLREPIQQRLENEAQRNRQGAYFGELKKRYKVAFNFDRPTAQVATGDRPALGAKDAPVTIVTFSDFECPFCKRVGPTIDRVMRDYRGKVKMYFRDYPLPFHKKARPAAMAAWCANEQGKFWQYHDQLFEDQKLETNDLVAHATKIGLDKAKFETCLSTEKFKPQMEADAEAGAKAGVNGTPAFFVNGILISGAVPFDKFKEVIDEELALAAPTSKKKTTVMP